MLCLILLCLTFSIILIYKIGKTLDSPAFFRPISLTSCVSKLFERTILSRLLFFLESNFILSPCQAGFHPGQSTLDQILFLSQSISDGFNKPRPDYFSKAFHSVQHSPFYTNSIRLASLLGLLVGLNLFFLISACVVYQNHKNCSFRFRLDVRQSSVLGPVLFPLFISDLRASLPSSISCFLYAGNLAIWSSSPSVPSAVEATRGALIRLECWSEYWCLLSIRENVRPPFQWISTKLTSHPTSSFSTPASVLIPLQLFLGSPSTALFPFLSIYRR